MKFDRKFFIGIVLLTFLIGTGIYATKHKSANMLAGDVTMGTSSPMQFQPEAQMLTEALNAPTQESMNKSDNPPTPDVPVTAGKNGQKYSYDKTICTNSSMKPYFCLSAYYKDIVSNYGSGTAIQDIKQRYNVNPDVVTQCHPLMHIIGRESSKSYGSVSEAYQHGDNFCWSGYYHGVMEGIIAKIGIKKLPEELNTICADIPGKESYNFAYYNCVHGLGHGIMEVEKDEDNVFDALKTCDYLSGEWERKSCYSGVFMENIIAAGYNGTSEFLKPTDPFYPCDAVDSQYKQTCYLGQTSYALQITHGDFTKVSTMCATLPSSLRSICDQSLGRDAASYARHDPAGTKAYCFAQGTPDDKIQCSYGAAKEMVSNYHSNVQATAFCNLLDKDYKEKCQAETDAYYSRL